MPRITNKTTEEKIPLLPQSTPPNNSQHNGSNLSKFMNNSAATIFSATAYAGNSIINSISSYMNRPNDQQIRDAAYNYKFKLGVSGINHYCTDKFNIDYISFNPYNSTQEQQQSFIKHRGQFSKGILFNDIYNSYKKNGVLQANELLINLESNYLFNDMVIHHDPLMVLDFMQSLKQDIINNPNLNKQEVNIQFNYLKAILIDLIDSPRPTNTTRLQFKDSHPMEDAKIEFNKEQLNAIRNMTID